LSRLPKRSGVEPHFVNPPISPPPKQTGLFQYAQMFRDGGERHGVRLRQVRHTFIAAREMSQDTPPGGIGQRSESTIQCSRRIFNHLVKQCSRPFPMQIKKKATFIAARLRVGRVARSVHQKNGAHETYERNERGTYL
jgi:hypothetical protein